MDKLKKIGACVAALLLCVLVNAQTQPASNVAAPAPADFMHSNGRIYVVVAVVVTILVGLFVYVFMLDRKISKLEKN